MAVLRLFAAAREAAGTRRATLPGKTVGEVLDAASKRYGKKFAAVLKGCKVWLNGEATTNDTPVGDGDEIAVLPPISGGSVGSVGRRLRKEWIGLGGARSAPRSQAARSGRGSRSPSPSASSPSPSPSAKGQKGRAAGRPRRYVPVHDVDGPRVRLGLLWFAGNVVALVVGLELLAPLYAVVAGVAAAQMAAAWRQRNQRPDRTIAIAAAVALPLTAAVGISLLGLVCIALGGAAVAQAYTSAAKGSAPIVDAGYTVQCALFPGMAAASLVLCHRFDAGLAVGVVMLAAAYDAGDYLVGSGSSNRFEGPVAGIAAVLCCSFSLSVLGVTPFEVPGGFAYGASAAVLCVVGTLLASALLPAVDAPGPALRRIDSLLVLAPVWAAIVAAIAA